LICKSSELITDNSKQNIKNQLRSEAGPFFNDVIFFASHIFRIC